MVSYKVAGLLCLVAVAFALPAQEEARGSRNAIQTENDLLDAISADCLRKDSMSCVKYKLFSFVDKMLGQKDTITVTEGVQIVKTEGGEPEGAPRALNGDETIESLILNRVARFLESHTIKIDLKGSEIVNAVSSTARSFGDVMESITDDEPATEEARGKKKKVQKVLGPLMAAAALKMAILGKLALAAIALIAGKALLVGKIALVLSAIIGLKKLLGGQGKHVTYEVVSHPQHSASHTASHETVYGGSGGGYGGDVSGGYSAGGSSSGHGGWGRALDAQKIAYRAHAQQ
ncbi:PREDICTED: uncharacterized protein LOC108566308 [Nicrophorus vespilloides]|uniref:Uncharacterized protein LOC108566308 n=1 Tax=Nicrophorus vespilloides TaxID=110193 RepID=A0ABM1N458_NICVS|nr:PREDICTED: uncharacterized protein LOC108566308 [Nicrophorus vespilloides]